eukprot:TRINITY_DN28736_c0_g1_i16.p2 TRINITY_DN28736_c0_g1~~TRINITY_DN28736_c0_g1_i16.p2  ORF type:complete len:105 (+),score=7.32 TRINITY_DN28736_c0_g1_i16:416-730(+)
MLYQYQQHEHNIECSVSFEPCVSLAAILIGRKVGKCCCPYLNAVVLTVISNTEMFNFDQIRGNFGASDTMTPPTLEAYISETIPLRIKMSTAYERKMMSHHNST